MKIKLGDYFIERYEELDRYINLNYENGGLINE